MLVVMCVQGLFRYMRIADSNLYESSEGFREIISRISFIRTRRAIERFEG